MSGRPGLQPRDANRDQQRDQRQPVIGFKCTRPIATPDSHQPLGLRDYLEDLDAVPVALGYEEPVVRAYGERYWGPEVPLDAAETSWTR